MANRPDSTVYKQRKVFYTSLLTIYGRKPVLEALKLAHIKPVSLHFADSNQSSNAIHSILQLASEKNVDVIYHSRNELVRLSKNKRQGKGVVLDIQASGYQPLENLEPTTNQDIIVVEDVTNPQNLGMIIRMVGASPCAGLALPQKGNANLSGLVIKASADAIFRTPIYYCANIQQAVLTLKTTGYAIIGLSSRGESPISSLASHQAYAFLLGNESQGFTAAAMGLCDGLVHIPLNHHVESLNVSVAAGLAAFHKII